jgi:5,10-methylenetetrahydromethanopterin reductase
VLVGASGPRNLALGGRFADGALVPGVNWKRDTDIVRQAAIEAGRDPGGLTMVMSRPCIVTDDPERDCAIVKPACLRLAQLGAAPMFAAAGFPIDVPPHDISDGDLGHPEDVAAAVATASRWISDEAAMWFARTRCLFGSPDDVGDQLRALEADGVTDLLVADLGAFDPPVDLIERFATDVLPAYRGRVG